MSKTPLFVLGVLVVLVIIFVYFVAQPPAASEGLVDAEKDDRCAEFREHVPEDDDIYSLGYKGRIRQILHGCF